MSVPPQPQSARDTILSAVRAHLPKPAVPLPTATLKTGTSGLRGGVGYNGSLAGLEQVDGFPQPGESLVPFFEKQLTAMGGCFYQVDDLQAAQAKILALYPEAKVRCSTVPGISGTRPVQTTDDPHSFADVDVAILRTQLAVAEAAALWFSNEDLIVPSLGVLAQHLVVLLEAKNIVPTLHEAYKDKLDLQAIPYGVFMAGPSATGDIEGVIIHGAQGARSLTVLLIANSIVPTQNAAQG